MKRGFFITLEGPDGCGKTTQSKLLAAYLRKRGFTVLQTREPGGTPFAEALRGLLLDPRHKVAPRTELMLFETIRAHHVEDILEPSLRQGKVVVCDRFTDSTVAYQGYGRGMDLADIGLMNSLASGGLKPDLTLVLNISPQEGLARIRRKKSGRGTDRMEREKLAFHRRVRQGFLKIAKRDPRRVKWIDAEQAVPDVHRQICAAVDHKMRRFRKAKGTR